MRFGCGGMIVLTASLLACVDKDDRESDDDATTTGLTATTTGLAGSEGTRLPSVADVTAGAAILVVGTQITLAAHRSDALPQLRVSRLVLPPPRENQRFFLEIGPRGRQAKSRSCP